MGLFGDIFNGIKKGVSAVAGVGGKVLNTGLGFVDKLNIPVISQVAGLAQAGGQALFNKGGLLNKGSNIPVKVTAVNDSLKSSQNDLLSVTQRFGETGKVTFNGLVYDAKNNPLIDLNKKQIGDSATVTSSVGGFNPLWLLLGLLGVLMLKK